MCLKPVIDEEADQAFFDKAHGETYWHCATGFDLIVRHFEPSEHEAQEPKVAGVVGNNAGLGDSAEKCAHSSRHGLLTHAVGLALQVW